MEFSINKNFCNLSGEVHVDSTCCGGSCWSNIYGCGVIVPEAVRRTVARVACCVMLCS